MVDSISCEITKEAMICERDGKGKCPSLPLDKTCTMSVFLGLAELMFVKKGRNKKTNTHKLKEKGGENKKTHVQTLRMLGRDKQNKRTNV